MGKFCRYCGKQVSENAKCCGSCGAQLVTTSITVQEELHPVTPKENEKIVTKKKLEVSTVQQGTKLVSKLVQSTSKASPLSGESAFVVPPFNQVAGVMSAISPFTTLVSGMKRIFISFKSAFKNKKALIPAVILAVTWIVLTVLPMFQINPLPVKLLSWLTFAQGGVSNHFIRMIGGIIGKGVVASFVISLFSGGNPFGKIKSGIKNMRTSFRCSSLGQAGALLLGMGFALVSYNFMAGFSSFAQSMVGISALFMTLRSLGSSGGFFRRFIGGFTAKKGSPVNMSIVNRIFAGMTTGFGVAIALSALPWAYAPYVIGLIPIVAGMIFLMIGKTKKEVVANE